MQKREDGLQLNPPSLIFIKGIYLLNSLISIHSQITKLFFNAK